MMHKLLLIFMLGCILFPGITAALMPPEDIAERNLQAELVLIGRVAETGKILLPLHDKDEKLAKGLFVLKTYHVIKGHGSVQPGDLVRIIYRLPPKVPLGMATVIAGNPPVQVNDGDLVLVHINATIHSDFYTPVMAGSSVVNIQQAPPEPPPADTNLTN